MSELTEPEKKILEAAKRVFEKHGFDGARMQQIADETGISKASLHYYFRSKEKLFDLIFEETMAEFLALVSTWEDDSELHRSRTVVAPHHARQDITHERHCRAPFEEHRLSLRSG